MKILITGAQGQLGKDTTSLWQEKGYSVMACSSQDLDITDWKKIQKTCQSFNPDIIINCAAYNAVDLAESEWEKAFRVNGLAVRYLSHAARQNKATLVHYSTDFVFNGESSRPYTILDTPSPVSRYGMSKLLGEQMVASHAPDAYLLRVSWVFGVGNVNFPRKILEWASSKDALTVVDDQVSSPSYTVDIAQATYDLIQSNNPGLYHVTNAGSCSRYQWAQYILEKTDWKGSIIPGKTTDFPAPAKRPAFSVLDSFGTSDILNYDLPDWRNIDGS